jgi:hypothetical protein
MRKSYVFSALLILSVLSSSIAEEPKQTRDEGLDTTSKELKEKYQTANASILATMINPEIYPGPVAGPGFYMGMNGPLISIAWVKGKDGEYLEAASTRYIPIESVLSVDQPMKMRKGPDRYVVYYTGPLGDPEFFILIDEKNENDSKSKYERFIERWKLYLLSQEP